MKFSIEAISDERFLFVDTKDNTIDRIFKHIDIKEGSECLLWCGYATGYKGYNYGRIWHNRRLKRVHRLMYEITQGNIPVNMEIHHECHNTLCVNPTHLVPVTHKYNVTENGNGRSVSAIAMRKTHCPNGHEYNKANTYINPNSGRRDCVACRRIEQRQRYMRRKAATVASGTVAHPPDTQSTPTLGV